MPNLDWKVHQPPPMGGIIPCTADVVHSSKDEDGFHNTVVQILGTFDVNLFDESTEPQRFDPGPLAQQIADMLNDGRLKLK